MFHFMCASTFPFPFAFPHNFLFRHQSLVSPLLKTRHHCVAIMVITALRLARTWLPVGSIRHFLQIRFEWFYFLNLPPLRWEGGRQLLIETVYCLCFAVIIGLSYDSENWKEFSIKQRWCAHYSNQFPMQFKMCLSCGSFLGRLFVHTAIIVYGPCLSGK